MSRLLSANFARLAKSKLFWLGMAFMLAIGIFITVNCYAEQVKYDFHTSLDSIFFGYSIIIGIICAVFCSLFIGTEYSDGTIRNKIIIGHTRNTIYMSNLLVCAFAGLAMTLIYIIAMLALGIPFFGFFTTDIKTILLYLVASFAAIVAFTSIFTTISMLNQNKAVVAVICLIGFIILLFMASYLNARLSAPEFYENYVITSGGSPMVVETVENPDYLRGTARAVCQFLYDFLPSGQALQISNFDAPNLWQMPIYSLIIIIVTTAVGLIGFKRKNLK